MTIIRELMIPADIRLIMEAWIKNPTTKVKIKSRWILTIKKLAILTEDLEVMKTLTEEEKPEENKDPEILLAMATIEIMGPETIMDAETLTHNADTLQGNVEDMARPEIRTIIRAVTRLCQFQDTSHNETVPDRPAACQNVSRRKVPEDRQV